MIHFVIVLTIFIEAVDVVIYYLGGNFVDTNHSFCLGGNIVDDFITVIYVSSFR